VEVPRDACRCRDSLPDHAHNAFIQHERAFVAQRLPRVNVAFDEENVRQIVILDAVQVRIRQGWEVSDQTEFGMGVLQSTSSRRYGRKHNAKMSHRHRGFECVCPAINRSFH